MKKKGKAALPRQPLLTAEEVGRLIAERLALCYFDKEEQLRWQQLYSKFLSLDVPTKVFEWLNAQHNQKQNVFARHFFDPLHLRQREALPFGENYSVLLSPLASSCPSCTCSCCSSPSCYSSSSCCSSCSSSSCSSSSSSSSSSPLSSSLESTAARAVVASVWFYQHLEGEHKENDEERSSSLRRLLQPFNDEGKDETQYHNLFATTRLPRRELDVLHHHHKAEEKKAKKGHAVAVMCRGRVFVLKVPRMDIDRRIEEQLHVVEKVEAVLHRITASSHQDKNRTASKYETTMMGYLTCAERDEAAAVREELEKEETNRRSLLRIQKALFVVCLDQHNENEGKEKEVNEKEKLWWYRKTCNYIPSVEETVCNRWFEKALQIVVTRGPNIGGHCQGSSTVRIALHVEHAALDSGVVHKFASYLYAYIDKLHHHQSLIAASANTTLMTTNEDDANVNELNWTVSKYILEHLRKVRQECLQHMEQAKSFTCEFCIRNLDRNFFKQKGYSPDACFQIALQMAYNDYSEDKKLITSNVETIDARHFQGARLILVDTATPQLCQFMHFYNNNIRATNDRNNGEEAQTEEKKRKMKQLFTKAVEAHQQLIRETATSGKETYLHLFFLSNEPQVVSITQQVENEKEEEEGLTNHKLYERLFDQKLASSNLGNDAGVDFVFSGVPPEGSPDVIGYMLRDHDIMVTFTTRRPSAAGDGTSQRWQTCLTSALSLVRELLSA